MGSEVYSSRIVGLLGCKWRIYIYIYTYIMEQGCGEMGNFDVTVLDGFDLGSYGNVFPEATRLAG